MRTCLHRQSWFKLLHKSNEKKGDLIKYLAELGLKKSI